MTVAPATKNVDAYFFAETARPDVRCLQCYSRHPAASEGRSCESCYMPRIMNAAITQRFGEGDSPNAGLRWQRW